MLLSKLEREGTSLALRERTGKAAAPSATIAECVPVDPDRSSNRCQEQGDEDGHQRSNERAHDGCDLRPALELTAVTPAPQPAPARLSPHRHDHADSDPQLHLICCVQETLVVYGGSQGPADPAWRWRRTWPA